MLTRNMQRIVAKIDEMLSCVELAAECTLKTVALLSESLRVWDRIRFYRH